MVQLTILYIKWIIEKLKIGTDVAKILAEEMYDANGGYYFNYLCLSAMYNEVCNGLKSELVPYIDAKVENIMEGDFYYE